MPAPTDSTQRAAQPPSRRAGFARNIRILMQAALHHAIDDPALLAVQVSRRMPWKARRLAGTALELATGFHVGIGALGSYAAGRTTEAEAALERRLTRGSVGGESALAGEVAILLDRHDLLTARFPTRTLARSAWAQGDLDGAIDILRGAGLEGSRLGMRLRSEIDLLRAGAPVLAARREARRGTMDELTEPGQVRGVVTDRSAPTTARDLRVLHLLTNSLPHTQSGYSLRSHRILTALRGQGVESRALTRTGYPVMIGVPRAHNEDIVDGIRYRRTLPSSLPQTQTQRIQVEIAAALDLVEEFEPQVLHATTNYLNALVAQSVSKSTGLPWIFEVRGLMEQTWVASHRRGESRDRAAASQRHRMVVEVETELARSADAVVTLSSTMADELIRRGVDPDAITLVPNAVDGSLLQDGVSPDRARALLGIDRSLGLGAEAVIVGAVSSLVDYEGFDVLLRAVSQLLSDPSLPAQQRERVQVVLAGEGVSLPGLIELAGRLGIADRVHFPGRVPRNQARRWVEALDVVVVPRRDVAVARAVTPQKPIEALALGRELIVSDLPALREIVTAPDGRLAARLVPAEDPEALACALADAIGSEGRGSAGGQDARAIGLQIAADRSWAHAGRVYRELYETVLDERRRA